MMPPVPILRRCPRCGTGLRDQADRSGNTFGGLTVWSDGVGIGPMMSPGRQRGGRCGNPACRAALWTDDLRSVEVSTVDDPPCVLLRAVGGNRIGAFRALRAATGLGLREVVALADQVPVTVSVSSDHGAVETLLRDLEAAGADAVGLEDTRAAFAAARELDPLDPEGYRELIDASRAPTLPGVDHRIIKLRREMWRAGNARFRGTGAPWQRYLDRPSIEGDNAARLFELLDDRSEDLDERLQKVELARQLERFDVCLALIAGIADDEYRRAAERQAELARAGRPELCVLFEVPPLGRR